MEAPSGLSIRKLARLSLPAAAGDGLSHGAAVSRGGDILRRRGAVRAAAAGFCPAPGGDGVLETMAGKGSEVGSRFEELAAIIDKVELKDKIGVCMDTCHVSDAGYDIINDLDGVLEEFDRIVGLDKLHAMHINDSLNPMGAHKDRHAKIGEGHLGVETIVNVITHPKLKHVPFILETPNELDGYAAEIALLRAEAEKR